MLLERTITVSSQYILLGLQPPSVVPPLEKIISDPADRGIENVSTTTPKEAVSSGLVVSKLQSPSSTISKGAWEKPLTVHSLPTRQSSDPRQSNDIRWPALSRGKQNVINNDSASFQDQSYNPETAKAEAGLIKAQSKNYPWAARMNQSMRNLHTWRMEPQR
ncbi:unnamed protein product [Arabis nemorensis]|uniref:Uncharacterized protein n=1 Tax=Arabis nemorensis TaxID=586526 RepID=A0A565CSE6_9BRAS|nr:unnamed protein product [Arabis nemorensis]